MLFNKNKRHILNTCVFITALLMMFSAARADDFQILSGTFFMATVSDSISVLEPGNNTGTLSEGTFQGITPTGPYPNSPVNRNVDSNQALFAPFPFFGQPVGTYTAATGVDGVTHAAPDIDLVTGVADMGSFYAYWNGTEFNQGNENATVIDNFDGTFKIFWSSLIVGGPFNGKTGDWVMVVECLTCPASTAGTSIGLSAAQGGVVTHTVTQDAGNFTVSPDLADTTGYTFNWSPTDDAVDGGAIISTDTLTIDPSMIPVGTYLIKVNISNNNTDPVEKSASTLLLTVVATGVLADIGDDDNDGVPNSSDTIADVTMLQTQDGNNTDYIMASDVGNLTLGNVAICAGHASASVTASDIKNNAGTGCIAVSNATDTLGEVQTGIGGYLDFAARNLVQGTQVQVVIPLSEPLSTNAGYRSYSFVDGWKPFASSATDTVYSTAGSPGSCPPASDNAWTAGLTKGDNCIRVTITDGGPNDSDSQPNGIVTSTGTTIGYAGINSDLVKGCSISGKPQSLHEHVEWLILIAFVSWLGYRRRTRI